MTLQLVLSARRIVVACPVRQALVSPARQRTSHLIIKILRTSHSLLLVTDQAEMLCRLELE
jgi:hypothetical protein